MMDFLLCHLGFGTNNQRKSWKKKVVYSWATDLVVMKPSTGDDDGLIIDWRMYSTVIVLMNPTTTQNAYSLFYVKLLKL